MDRLPAKAWWLLNRISAGDGKPVSIVCHISEDEHVLEALEDSGYVVVGAGAHVHEYLASIVDKGREAIQKRRKSQAEIVATQVGRTYGKKTK
jgi:hypothetical protein